MVEAETQIEFAVYLLEAEDNDWIETEIAIPLKDKEGLSPYFFKWESIPGNSRQQSMADGFKKSKCCAVCLGGKVLGGLEKRMQELATERQAKNPEYRLIPVLLPGSDSASTPEFLIGIDSIDFRAGSDFEKEFYRLVCGIRNKPPGPPELTAKIPVAKIPPAEEEKINKQYQVSLNAINAAEKKGLFSAVEAEKLRDNATNKMLELIIQNVSVGR